MIEADLGAILAGVDDLYDVILPDQAMFADRAHASILPAVLA